ncbi:MAG: O-antigen ligase family protein [Kiritimatiellia bacterium]
MDFLFKNLAVILVFLTMAACTWLNGGLRVDSLVPTLPWMLAFLFEGMLFFPQRRPYEDVVSARRRVWRGLRGDPLLYFTLAFLLVLAIPLVNRGLCPSCDYPLIMKLSVQTGLSAEDVAKPPVPFAPFCVNIQEQFNVLLWFLPALTGALAARHALSRQGKRMLMEMMVWNAAALAVLGFIQQGSGAEFPYWGKAPAKVHFFSVFAYPNMGGAFFVMAFAFAVGLWQHRVQEVAALPRLDKANSLKEQTLHRWLRAHYPLVAVALIFFGVLCTLCRAALMLVFSLAALAFVYYVVSLLFSRHERARRVRHAAFALGGGLFFLLIVFVFAPPDMGKELGTIDSVGVLDRVSGKAQYHTRVATEIFKDYPFFGVGGWGYKHFTLSYLKDEELSQLQKTGGANVHNDYLQFLCEHGAVGMLLLLGIFLLLAYPVCRDWCRLYRAARFMKAGAAPPPPRAIYCLPAGAFWILLGDVALIIHACGDCPMRSASVLSMFFVSLACAEGYIPREITEGR